MSLKVIGSGVGRTGTFSLKLALEQLGFGKCYHMYELFQQPANLTYFKQAEAGRPVNWDKLLEGFSSAVDYPIARYHKQLLAKYPGAKVIHTMRDAETWYQSASETIFWACKPSISRKLQLIMRMPFSSMVRQRLPVLQFDGQLLDWEFGKDLKDKKTVIKRYNDYNDAVIKSVPKENLLVYQPGDGWEPLCNFLQVPVPLLPFPKSNTREEFKGTVAKIANGARL